MGQGGSERWWRLRGRASQACARWVAVAALCAAAFSTAAILVACGGSPSLALLHLGIRRIDDSIFPRSIHYQVLTPRPEATAGPLRVDPANRRYLMDQRGRPLVLVGSNYWNLLQDGGRTDPPPAFDFDAFVGFAVAHGYNYLRWHTWEHAEHTSDKRDWYIRPSIYRRPGPGLALDGQPKFDLGSFNPEFFDRLRSRVMQAGAHGLYAAVDLFQAFSIADGNTMSGQWRSHPFQRDNNVNGIDGDPQRRGDGKDIETLRLPQVTKYQRDYLKHVIETLNDLDNVIWEVAIEPDGAYSRDGFNSFDWVEYFVDQIHSFEAKLPRQHPVLYSSLYPGGRNERLLGSRAEVVAPNGEGGFLLDAPVLKGDKVVLIDTDHIAWTETRGADWAWRAFTRGAGGFAIMDGGYSDYDDQGGGATYEETENFRFNLGWIRYFSSRLDLTRVTPDTAGCSSRYCLSYAAKSGAEHLVYLPPGRTMGGVLGRFGWTQTSSRGLGSLYLPADSEVTVDLSSTPGTFAVEWMSTETGVVSTAGDVAGGSRVGFTAPFPGAAVLYVHQK